MKRGFCWNILSYTFAAWGSLSVVPYMEAVGAASSFVTLIGDQEFLILL